VEQFISALLDISKLDAGKAIFDVQPLQLSKIFRPLRDELTPLAANKGIDLRIVDCNLTIVSDPGYMRRIVQNLLSNAIRYTDSGRILMGVRRVGELARIEVWDTGRGIAPDDQAKIFKEFERIAPNNSDTGLGLGLSIVERACQELEHDLTLVSEPGRGSCFSITVPIDQSQSRNGPDALTTEARKGHTFEGKLYLLITPAHPLQTHLTAMIEQLGATVIHAETAEDALAILQEVQLIPDALLIDGFFEHDRDPRSLYSVLQQQFGEVPSMILMPAHDPEASKFSSRGAMGLIGYPNSLEQLVDTLQTLHLDQY
jgi:CheY-like chemotaxis protein